MYLFTTLFHFVLLPRAWFFTLSDSGLEKPSLKKFFKGFFEAIFQPWLDLSTGTIFSLLFVSPSTYYHCKSATH